EISDDGFLETVVEWTGDGAPPTEVRLAAGGRVDLSLRVLGVRPMPEWLRVTLRSGRGGRDYSVRVEDDGTARIGAIPPGDVRLEVFHDDFPLPEPLSFSVAEGDVLERSLDLDAREPPIVVVVTDAGGRPIEGANVELRVEADGVPGREARHLTTLHTSRDGRAQSGLLRSAGVLAIARAKGRNEREIRDARASANAAGEVRVVLDPAS
ncbi:MAG: carboxypeptidase regulatory-like domain-containing protein, partial [Myxococcales bacterium]|nr:carboxypeptidase regulatory-like domain-containing protein [Myxococcales bacterium]